MQGLYFRANDDPIQFLENVNNLCDRISRKLNLLFKRAHAIEMAGSILNNSSFNFQTIPDFEVVKQLQSCAVPAKTAQDNSDAKSINKVANLATYARDLNIINEIDHATKTPGYGTIVIVYGAGHFLTQQGALEFLAN